MLTDQMLYSLVLVVVVGAAVIGVILVPTQTTSVLGFASMICVSVLGLLTQKKVAEKVDQAVEKVDHLAITTQETQQTTATVHTLVNSNMGGQLRFSMMLARRVADLTKDDADVQTADEAKRLYDEHVASQKVVDSNGVAGPAAAVAPPVPAASASVDVKHLQPPAVEQIVAAAKPDIAQAATEAVADAMPPPAPPGGPA